MKSAEEKRKDSKGNKDKTKNCEVCRERIYGILHIIIYCRVHLKFLKKYIPEAIVTVLRAFTNASYRNFYKNKICTLNCSRWF